MADTANIAGRLTRMLSWLQRRGYMPLTVRLAVVTYSGANANAGDPGTASAPTYTTIPNALVDLKDQYVGQQGMTLRVGDARITWATAAMPVATVLAASWVEVAGTKYTVVAGQVTTEAWVTSAVLARRQQ